MKLRPQERNARFSAKWISSGCPSTGSNRDHFLQADLSLLIGSTWITSGLPTARDLPMFALPPVNPRSATSRYRNKWKELLAVELPQRDANRSILVRGCKPEFVLLCDAEELLHLPRSWRCGRPVRIEWPCELAEEAVEFLLGHDN
jgi:hypothetical protein